MYVQYDTKMRNKIKTWKKSITPNHSLYKFIITIIKRPGSLIRKQMNVCDSKFFPFSVEYQVLYFCNL
jgi:hypothetical protein